MGLLAACSATSSTDPNAAGAGANTATAAARTAVGDQVGFDFDSNPADIAAGATPISPTFISGTAPSVFAQILNAAGAVLASGTASGRVR